MRSNPSAQTSSSAITCVMVSSVESETLLADGFASLSIARMASAS